MFKDPDLFELDQATRQAIYRAAQADLDNNHNLSWRDSILNHAEREFKSRLAGYISHLEHKSEQDSATVLGQALHIASLLDQVSELVKQNEELKTACDEQEPYCLADCKNIAKLERQLEALRAQIGQGVPVAWKHDCAVLLANDVELWIDVCPHCGKPRYHPAPQPAQANYLEMIYEYLVSTAPAGYADEAFREVPEEVFAADSRNRISERRASLSQHTGQLPAALGQEEVGTRQAGFDVTSAHPAPQQKPLTDEQDRALCEAYCNAASGEYFKARPQLDSDVNRRIFYAGHRKAWIEWQAAHNIGEKK